MTPPTRTSPQRPSPTRRSSAAVPRRRGFGFWVGRLLLFAGLGAVAGIVLLAGLFFWASQDLPSVEALRTYKPPQVSKVFCADGTLCGEYYIERRTYVPIETLPAHVRNAFIAAEDADFYKHEGLDYMGMVRAALRSLIPGKRITGASTITQQACKNLLLSQERTLTRKIKEWILTPRMEKALTKEQILGLYLNQIYFGHLRYGIEEASLFYFGKHARDLNVGEAATLAGTVQLPHRINPVTNIVKAKNRQRYVLGQLEKHGLAPANVVAKELEKPITLAPRPPPPMGPYYAEEIRKLLVGKYGDDMVLKSGLRVDTAMDSKLQKLADDALRMGLEAVDHRMGYQGPMARLESSRFEALRKKIALRIEETGKRTPNEVLVADLTSLAQPTAEGAEEGAEEKPEAAAEDGAAPSADEVLVRQVALKPLVSGLSLAGFVRKVEDGNKRAEVDLVGRTVTVPFSSVSWARPRAIGKWSAPPNRISEVLKPGDIVRVRITGTDTKAETLEATLDQVPQVQGALVVIDPKTRYVSALAGGYDFKLSVFNRATQAKRQPGSAFKPFLYTAGLASQRFTPISVMNDAPEAIRDPYTGKTWKPQNYEKGGFEGPMTLRQALTKSKNTVSVRLIEALTPAAAVDLARKAGITSEMPDNLTLALGTGEVSVLELANAYTTLQSQGKFADPILVVRVTDAQGRVLEEHQAAFEERLPPAVAYLGTSLMRSVVEEGTAMAVKELNRPAAGKTGTASEFRDAWFSGYTADYVATAWVGFDNHDSLGTGETGGKAALPIWLQVMKGAHENLPTRDFEIPPGIVTVRIDPATGLLAGASIPGREEPFLEGTQPTAESPPPGTVDPSRLFLEDSRKGGM
jgi:penicillin-binding protein 1A